jgi:L-2,4-diaminobutyrate decarboxylase
MARSDFDHHFLTPDSSAIYRSSISLAVDTLVRHYGSKTVCYSGKSARALAAEAATIEVCPELGRGLDAVLADVGAFVLEHSLVVSNPTCIAHLHCPPLLPALAAEVLISATNQSMDSWDQAPAATYVEQRVVDWLCDLFGYPDGDGIFTSGGTQSNLMGMLFARDAYARRQLGWDIQARGLPAEAPRFRILCSAVAHFSVKQSAALLGLGHDAVVLVATDASKCMDPTALAGALARLQAEGLLPIAVVATAGTTDFGSIDPLEEVAAIAAHYGIWLHVDAAYGGALALSQCHAGRLRGIALADSLTVDFHKLFYQPVSCGAFLSKHARDFSLIQLHADYLNPESNEQAGILDLVGKSIQTTRRFDGLKLLMTLQCLGRVELARMIDATLALAQEAAMLVKERQDFELADWPGLNAVVFRYAGQGLSNEALDRLNAHMREALLARGIALLAQTRTAGRIYLKMTLLNPRTTLEDVIRILDALAEYAQQPRST